MAEQEFWVTGLARWTHNGARQQVEAAIADHEQRYHWGPEVKLNPALADYAAAAEAAQDAQEREACAPIEEPSLETWRALFHKWSRVGLSPAESNAMIQRGDILITRQQDNIGQLGKLNEDIHLHYDVALGQLDVARSQLEMDARLVTKLKADRSRLEALLVEGGKRSSHGQV